MAGYGVGYLVAHHYCKTCFILHYRHYAAINHNFTTRHTPCVSLVVIHKVKIPLVATDKTLLTF